MKAKNKTLTEADIAEHDRRIVGVLNRAFDEHGLTTVTNFTPADAMMAKEVDFEPTEKGPNQEYGWPGDSRPRLILRALKKEEAAEVAYIARRDLVWWLCGDGLHPFKILQRFYALLYASFPDQCGSIDGSWLAEILGQGRAAFSALMGRLFGSVAEERLGRSVKVGGQKAAAASEKYAINARLNKPKRQLNGEAGVDPVAREKMRKKIQIENKKKLEEQILAAEKRDLQRDADEYKRIIHREKTIP